MPYGSRPSGDATPGTDNQEPRGARASRRRFLALAAGGTTAGLAGCTGGGGGEQGTPPTENGGGGTSTPLDIGGGGEETPTPEASQGTEFIPSDVLQAAREEGTATIWSAMDEPDLKEDIQPRFREEFPEIQATFSGFGSAEIATKLVSENRSGNIESDVTTFTKGTARAIGDTGVFIELENDHWLLQQVEEMGYAPAWWSPEAGSPAYELPGFGIPYTLFYHTEKMSEDEAPDSWEALGDDQWTGDMGLVMQNPSVLSVTAELFATLRKQWGHEKWVTVVEDIVDNNPQLTPSNSQSYRTLVQGERGLAITLINDLVGQLADDEEPPVALTWLDPSMMLAIPTYLTTDAPNPNAAMVVASWWLSEMGQQAIGDTGRTPSHGPTASTHNLFEVVIPEDVTIRPGAFNNPTYEGNNFVTNPDAWEPLFEEYFGSA